MMMYTLSIVIVFLSIGWAESLRFFNPILSRRIRLFATQREGYDVMNYAKDKRVMREALFNYAVSNQKKESDVKDSHDRLSFNTFCEMTDIRSLLEPIRQENGHMESLFTREELSSIWKELLGSMDKPATFDDYSLIADRIDELCDDQQAAEQSIGEKYLNYPHNVNEDGMVVQLADQISEPIPANNALEFGFIRNPSFSSSSSTQVISKTTTTSPTNVDMTDLWRTPLNPLKWIDKRMVGCYRDFFDLNCDKTGIGDRISLDDYLKWTELQVVLEKSRLETSFVKDLWASVVAQRIIKDRLFDDPSTSYATASDGSNSLVPILTRQQKMLSWEDFLRVCILIDNYLDEVSVRANHPNDQAAEFYSREFKRLAIGGQLVTLSELLKWPVLRSRVKDGTVDTESVNRLWTMIPKQPPGRYQIGFGDSKQLVDIEEESLREDMFIAFNLALDNGVDKVMKSTD